MRLIRQGGSFLIVGLAQLLLDWAVFVGVTALGMPVEPGNVVGRIAGMLLGFWLNGRFTFANAEKPKLGWTRFIRFLAVWLVLTILSTLLVGLAASHLGLAHAWLAKPLVEGVLAAASFLFMRHFVYR